MISYKTKRDVRKVIIHFYNKYGTLGMVFNFIVSALVSRMTSPPPNEIQDMVDDIRIPQGAGQIAPTNGLS